MTGATRVPACSARALRAFLGGLLPLLAGCEKPAAPIPAQALPPPRPDIILVMIDTLRADRLGAYRNPAGNSPNLDGIAADGVTFERAIAPAPWTQPSIASLFCACYPGVHKVLDYRHAFRATFGGEEKIAVFDASFQTLAECLRDQGYATAGFVANPYIVRDFGFAQGFEHFDTSFANNTTPGGVVNQAVVTWLRQRDRDQPFFLYLHYMDCHGPYDSAPEFLEPLLDRVEQMPNKRALTDPELKKLDYLRKLPAGCDDPDRHHRLSRYQEYWAARYDAGIRQVDHYVGELRSRLAETGLWNDAYVIVTADHGEALCEHGFWEHGWSTHHTELHVPLILRWRGTLPAGKRVRRTVRLIDLMPTLLDQLRVPRPHGMQGISLSPAIAGRPPLRPQVAFAEGVKMGPEQKAVYVGDWKLIQTLEMGRLQLYRIAEDPLEQTDLVPRQPSLLATLVRALEEQVARNGRLAAGFEARQVPLTPEQRKRLESLGYIGR